MEAKAILRYARISPRKVKIVIDLIRNKPVGEAMGILKNTPKAASEILIKLLNSAIANATANHNMDVEKLYVAASDDTYNHSYFKGSLAEFAVFSDLSPHSFSSFIHPHLHSSSSS